MEALADNPAILLKELTRLQNANAIANPLATALHSTFPQADDNEIMAAAIICALYLSHIKEQLPIHILRTYCTAVKETTATIPFDCRMYDSITAALPLHNDTCPMLLLDTNGIPRSRNITRQDIYDALDFYTNR